MQMQRIELKVEGMHCGGCENAVRVAVNRVAGVESVEADHHSGRVVVGAVDGADLDSIKAAIRDAGYDVT